MEESTENETETKKQNHFAEWENYSSAIELFVDSFVFDDPRETNQRTLLIKSNNAYTSFIILDEACLPSILNLGYSIRLNKCKNNLICMVQDRPACKVIRPTVNVLSVCAYSVIITWKSQKIKVPYR